MRLDHEAEDVHAHIRIELRASGLVLERGRQYQLARAHGRWREVREMREVAARGQPRPMLEQLANRDARLCAARERGEIA